MAGQSLKPFRKVFRFLFSKLVLINDTPQRISLGFALGVCSGIIPGTGPLAALTLAVVFKVNRFAALIGSVATNTWLSIVTLIPAIKLGSAILHLKWTKVYSGWLEFFTDFQWQNLLKLSVYKIILPVLLGYVTISLFIAVIVYLFTICILINKKHGIKNRSNLS